MVFNTVGEALDAPVELVQLLQYMGCTTPEMAVNENLARIQSFVIEVKKKPEVKEAYMNYTMLIHREIAEATAKITEEAEEANKKNKEANEKAEKAKVKNKIYRKCLLEKGMTEKEIDEILSQRMQIS
ncbi:MAG: hypothetical protein Q4A32_03340 [Lachnospiraceae bacterium]|nr:hypothetical protein [Lachnospiraceae bacterium]